MKPFRDNRPHRHCFICDSNSTYIDKTGRHQWRCQNNKWFCCNCFHILERLIQKNGYQADYAIEYLVAHSDDILIMRDKPKQAERECYGCGTTISYVDRYGIMHWRLNRDARGRVLHVLCSPCNNRYIDNPLRNPINQKKRLTFQDKRISLPENPRTGFCSRCGRVDLQTHMHHEHYDLDNPLSGTIELCCSCHMKRSRELKQLS